MQHKKLWIALGVAVAAAAGLAYDYLRPQEPAYMTVRAQRHDITRQVFASGTLAGKVEVDVGAQVSGQIKKLYVKTGDKVKKGDLLCEIDPQIQENNLKSAQAQQRLIKAQITAKKADLTRLKLELARQVKLRAADASSRQSYEEVKAQTEMAAADLEALAAQLDQADLAVADAKTNLGYTRIMAPMDGTVYAIPVEEGQTVNANQTTPTILKLAALDHMTVEAEISEADVVLVKPGMDCTFTILGLPSRPFQAKLDRIEPAPASAAEDSSSKVSSSSSSSGNEAVYYNALMEVANPDGLLRIDMTADVAITIASLKQVLALPVSALAEDDYAGKGAVRVLLPDGSIQERQLELGLRDDQYVAVLKGLSAQDEVIVGDDVATASAKAKANSRQPPRMF